MKCSAKRLLKKQKMAGMIMLTVFTLGLVLSIAWKEDCTPLVLMMALSAKAAFSKKLLF